MQPDLPPMVHLMLNLSLFANLSSFLPGVAVGFAAVAMARSHRRRHTAVIIGAFALAGLAAGTLAGFLFMSTPEDAGHLAGAALLAGVIAASIWELARKPQTE
jgi:putative Mn2+ efflux pump MntP